MRRIKYKLNIFVGNNANDTGSGRRSGGFEIFSGDSRGKEN